MTHLASLDQARDAAKRNLGRLMRDPSRRWRYLAPPVAVGLVSVLMLPARNALGVLNVALIYLLVCFALALVLGAGPAVLGPVLSFFAFNLFFIPPYHTLTIARTDHVFALFVYLGVAVVTAQLVARVQARTAEAARERARVADEAARATALAQSDALKSALLAAVSHDLRTPLATIKTAATSLLDPGVDWSLQERDEFLWAIDEETDRLALVVGNLLDLSRIEGGALTPDKDWYDVAEVVEDVAGRLATRARQHGHVVTTDVEPDLPLVRFDYVVIAQVLTNLGENALKYTPPGTEVTMAAWLLPGAIELSVRDSGRGISPEDVPHVFDKFYRAEKSGRVPGTGIGLAIAKGLVEAHGGRIGLDSRVGEGTVVRFTLPLTEPATDEAEA